MTWPELAAVVVVGFVVNLLVHVVRDRPKAVAFLLGVLSVCVLIWWSLWRFAGWALGWPL